MCAACLRRRLNEMVLIMTVNAYAATALAEEGWRPKNRATIGMSVTQNRALLLSQIVARSSVGKCEDQIMVIVHCNIAPIYRAGLITAWQEIYACAAFRTPSAASARSG